MIDSKFLKTLGPEAEPDKGLYLLYYEFNANFKSKFTQLQSIKKKSDNILLNKMDLLEGLATGISYFTTFTDTFLKFENNVISNLENIKSKYIDLAFNSLQYGIYGILVFFSIVIGITFTLLMVRIKTYKPFLNIQWMFMGFLAMYMLLFTAVFFMIIVTLREFCFTFEDLRTDATKFDAYSKSGFFPTEITSNLKYCLHGNG